MNRPIVIIGGWLSSPGDYLGMARILASPPYGRIVYVTDIGRGQWLALRDPDFRPVLELLARTVETALRETGAEQADLIGHSAGGRIARAYLGDEAYLGPAYRGHRRTASLITLGTAHSTVEVFVAKFGAWINEAYPGAYYRQVCYRSVAGQGVFGRRLGSPEQIFAFRSYELTCGEGHVDGDGVIPIRSCYLAGADNLLLRGARHAPYNAPFTWYGARDVVPLWFE